ncbi:MAG: response regulator transcription factor [Pseudomonadota bacterium]
MSTTHHFIIADDHPLFRDALKTIVASRFDGARISEAGDIDAVTELLQTGTDVDLVLLDLNMPGVRGFSGLMYLRAQYPGVPVCIVSATEDQAIIRRSLDFGAAGFMPKSLGVDQISAGIEAILDGDIWTPEDLDLSNAPDDDEAAALAKRLSSLTPQQVRVLMMLSQGLLNKQIAYELGVSEATVKAHVSAILQKLNVESRTQAVIAASRIEMGNWQEAVAELAH